MLYERKLKQVPVGWGMQNESFDMFFYQEDDAEDGSEDNLSRIYCFIFREAKEEGYLEDELRLHAFSLPNCVTQKQREEQNE